MTLPVSLIRKFRDALGAAVQEIIDIPIKEGVISGPLRDRDEGCVYLANVQEDSNVVRQMIHARVRVFLRADQQPAEDVPLSMAPLEDIVEAIQVQMSAGDQTLLVAGIWFCRLTEFEFNHQQYGVEMAFLAYSWNQWAVVQPRP